MSQSDSAVVLSTADVRQLALDILTANGIPTSQAAAMSDVLTRAQADDAQSHGLYRLPGCLNAIRSGRVDPKAEPTVISREGAVIRIDANNGFAPLALQQGRVLLSDVARTQGIGLLAIHNCYHFSALWADVEPLAHDGLVAIACTVGTHCVALANGRRPAIGTNPMAFAFPRGEDRDSFVFDQSSSVVARGEIELHRRDGKTLPADWAIDSEGHPTTDPMEALDGAILPFGGHKGAALGLMVELLAGPLLGEVTSREAMEISKREGGPLLGGYLMIAIDPKRFSPSGSNIGAADAWLQMIVAENPGARLPSTRRYAARLRSASEGVPIPAVLYEELMRLGDGGSQS